MKKAFSYIFFSIILLVSSCSFTENFYHSDSSRDKLLMEIINYLILKEHYKKAPVDDAFSERVFNAYLNTLDPFKRVFTQSDIQHIRKHRKRIDNQIKKIDLTFFEDAYSLFLEKRKKTKSAYIEILDTPYDFTKDEKIYVNYDSLPYVRNDKALKRRWKKQLKMMVLFSLYSSIEDQENDSINTPKSITTLEKEARDSVRKSLNDMNDVLEQMENEDWFVIYLNTILNEYDPHDYYFDPNKKEAFDTEISGKFEGIGARLLKRGNKISIEEVISGGPAWRSKKLEVGDLILKVAQTPTQIPVDVGSMRIRDAVKLIKGPKDSTVYLTIKHIDGNINVISIVRDIVNIEETYLKTALLDTEDGKIAVIKLPKFYVDFNDYKTERNAASDMKKELHRLSAINTKGLILDLRNNGGGSLKTVVDIAGLFIKKGPVVQINSSNNKKTVLNDKDPKVQWNKPLVILVNELSASASEILAAAMQDYKRAIIQGSTQTYGKGTVQNVVDLNLMVKNNSFGDLGALKFTTQKFYRINGESTQLKGVESDVVIPDKRSYMEIGERKQDNAMPWDKITPSRYKPYNNTEIFTQTIQKSKNRISQSKYFKLIDKMAKYIKTQQDKNTYTLNLEKYRQRMKKNEDNMKEFEVLNEYNNHLDFNAMLYEIQKAKKDSSLLAKSEDWHKVLSKDFYIEEAVNTLKELMSSPVD